MTDRVNRLTVVLEEDFRDDDIDQILGAIRLMRGVLAVEPHVADTADFLAQERARRDLREKILDLVR